ncbi:DUF3617 domain-containing protein [Sphingomonas jaspsi]|uniref:DUF3617 domain-containing protein n=1 Tax=Sphingomonas jaspsi TaxID=392409 RepID=UPI0004BCD0D4|nr:DUF3617 family protein [Sphingomonas jaspsi]
MNRGTRITLAIAAIAASAVAVAAAGPRALAPATGGLWEVSRNAQGQNAQRLCVPDPAALAQYEHLGQQCTRVVIADHGTQAVFHYTCADGGFGRSDVTLITPRTLRVDTQGINRGLPFHYQLHARRVGECSR